MHVFVLVEAHKDVTKLVVSALCGRGHSVEGGAEDVHAGEGGAVARVCDGEVGVVGVDYSFGIGHVPVVEFVGHEVSRVRAVARDATRPGSLLLGEFYVPQWFAFESHDGVRPDEAPRILHLLDEV